MADMEVGKEGKVVSFFLAVPSQNTVEQKQKRNELLNQLGNS